jgi:hypothetical protein
LGLVNGKVSNTTVHTVERLCSQFFKVSKRNIALWFMSFKLDKPVWGLPSVSRLSTTAPQFTPSKLKELSPDGQTGVKI